VRIGSSTFWALVVGTLFIIGWLALLWWALPRR
jgi:hypothetical protein